MPHPVELVVPPEATGARLDTWLAEQLSVPRARAAALAHEGAILLDGRPAAKSARLRGGQHVRIVEQAAQSAETTPPPEIAWEDEHLIVVDKPPGLVVHPAPGHRGTTLVELLAERAPKEPEPRAVHRLDRDTSGLMLVAKGEPVQRRLQA